MNEPLLVACRRPRRLRPRRGARRRVVRGAGARRPRRAWPQRRRQVDAASHHHGLHPNRPRPHLVARRGHHGAAAAPPRAGRHRLGGAGARDFRHADCRGKPHRRRARGALGLAGGIRSVSAACRTPAQFRQPAVRRRAADAGDRARADDQSGAVVARRAARRPGADRRRGACRRDRAA